MTANNSQNNQASQGKPSTPEATAKKTVDLHDYCDYFEGKDIPENTYYVPEDEFNQLKEKTRPLNDYSDDDEDETDLKRDTAISFIMAIQAQEQSSSSAAQNKPAPLSDPVSAPELANLPTEDTAEETKLVSVPANPITQTVTQTVLAQSIHLQAPTAPQEDKSSLTKPRSESTKRATRSRGQTHVYAQSGSNVNVFVNPTFIIQSDKEPEQAI